MKSEDWHSFLKVQDKSPGSWRASSSSWTIQNIEAGFEKFYEENGRYPSAPEIDIYDYLPSSRQIQRAFGGLQALRKNMNLMHEVVDHNRGKIRSDIAGIAMKRASDYEEMYYDYLTQRIPEVYVHEHKVLRHNNKKTDTDFYIYYPDEIGGVAIDLFYAIDILNLLKQVAIKVPKYISMPMPIYFVNMNENLPQEVIQQRILNKKILLPNQIKVCSLEYFNTEVLPNIIKRFKQYNKVIFNFQNHS